jgi:hypothetical protein
MDIFSIVTLLGCVENPVVMVELGCWAGASTIALGVFGIDIGVKKFYTVDNFKGEDIFTLKEEDGLPREILNRNLEVTGLKDFVNVIESDSSKAADLFEDNSVDFIFIDADHKYYGIKKDLIAWYPKVKENGIFCGHDFEDLEWDDKHIEEDFYDGRHHGVIKATQEIFSRVNWLPHKIWWANKNNKLVNLIRAPNMEAINLFDYSSGGDGVSRERHN